MRWALFVEKAYGPVQVLRQIATADMPDGLPGPAGTAFMGARAAARSRLAQTLEMLLLDDASEDDDG